MIDLSKHSNILTYQNSNFHIDSKIIAIHGIDAINSNNIKDKLINYIDDITTTIYVNEDWSGFVGYINIEDELIYVSSANINILTVVRGQHGTVADNHNINSNIYTVNIFKNVTSYEWNQGIGVNDRDLFSIEIDNGKIILDDLSKNWNKLYVGCLYSFKKNKEVFIFEGCNGQVTKVWEGLTENINNSAENNEITIFISGYFNKYADEPIKNAEIYNDKRPKELLETMFEDFLAEYVGNVDANDYFKINNLSTTEFSTYRDFINYICKEYAIRLLFRKNKTIHIISDMFPNKITPIASIKTEVIKINNDTSGNIIINNISGTYKERNTLKPTSYSPVRFRKFKNFSTTIDIILNGIFQEISLIGLSYSEISTMTYQEYILIETNVSSYMCKLIDIIKIAPNQYTVKILAGYDKASYWNEKGRIYLEGNNIQISSFTLRWSYDELPIIWKYARQINDEETTSNIMFPLFPSEDYIFYIDNFGVSSNSNSNFSGIIKGFETLLNKTMTNSTLYYNQEYKQNNTVPIYLYTNKISSTHPLANDIICIDSIDNSDVSMKIEYSDIKNSMYKITLKNTLSNSPTIEITPSIVMSGQKLLKLSKTDYDLCYIGDALKLKEINSSDEKYNTYYSFKDSRYLICSKFSNDGEYFIVLNDYYPLAEGTEFTFVKYNRNKIILLNELYFRANPIMEAEINYEFSHNESIAEYGTKDYTIEGKSISKEDFLKITSYIKNTYNGMNENSIRNKVRMELMRRVDVEAGDFIYLTDTVYTQYSNQMLLITQKNVSVDSGGERTESYEGITIGNYSINAETLENKQILSWSPDIAPTFNHIGSEGTLTQEQDKQSSNNRIVIQDLTEGQIYVEEISQSLFYANTDVSSIVTSENMTFELGLKNVAIGNYRNSLLSNGTEGVIRINSEYLSYKSLGYDGNSNTATLQIIKRGIGNTKLGDITSNIRVQFYKIITKISAKGLKSTDLMLGDGTDNYIEIHTDTGVQIKSNKIIDISNSYNALKFDNSDNSGYIILNNGKIKLGKNAVDTNKDGFYIYKDTNNYISYNITDDVFILKTEKGYIGNSTNYFDITNSKLNIGTNGKIRISSTHNTTTTLFQAGDISGNYLKFDTVTGLSARGNFDINGGSINITTTDTYNQIYFDSTHSIIKLNTNDSSMNWGLQIGKSNSSNNYFNFDSNGLIIKSNNINLYKDISNYLIMDSTNSSISLYKSSTDKFTFDITNGVEIISSKGKIGSTTTYFDITNKNITLGIDGSISIGSASNMIIWDNTNGLIIKSTKIVDISNTNNAIYFDGDNSYIRMNTNKIKLGKDAISTNDDGLYIYLNSDNYLKYSITNSLFEVKSQNGYIGSSVNYFDITNGKINLGTGGKLRINSSDSISTTLLYIGSGSNYLKYDTSTGIDINTVKFNLADTGNASLISLNSGKSQIGSGIVISGWGNYNGLFIGDTTISNENYIKYDIGNSRFTFGDNVQIAGIMKTGDQIKVINNSASTVVKYGEIDSSYNIFGFDYTSPTDPSGEYFRLADSTSGTYTHGLSVKTKGTIDISNTNNSIYFSPADSGNNSYIHMNEGKQQIGRVVGLTGKSDFNGIFLGDKTISNSKYLYYDGVDFKVSGDITLSSNSSINSGASLGGTIVSTVVSNASNGNTAYTGTSAYRNNSAPTNNATFGTLTNGTATSDGNIVVNIPYSYTQGSIVADNLLFFVKEGGGTVTSSDPCYITNAITSSIVFTLKPNTTYSFGIQAVRRTESGLNGTSILSSSNITTISGNYTGLLNTNNSNNYLYVGSDIKIGKDAVGSGLNGISITSNGYLNIANNNNIIYFDPTTNGDNSYIRLNNNKIKFGKDAIAVGDNGLYVYQDSNNYLKYSITNSVFEVKTQKGFIGSGTNYFDITNGMLRLNSSNITPTTLLAIGGGNNYFNYDTSTGLVFSGKFFNGTAYCRDNYEFIGAMDTSKQYIDIVVEGVHEVKQNPFWGMIIKNVVVMNNIDISGLDSVHFSTSNYIIPSDSIGEITSLDGQSNTTIYSNYWGFLLNYPIKITNLTFSNCGSSTQISSYTYSIAINSQNCYLQNLSFINIKKSIGSITPYADQEINNITITSYSVSDINTQNNPYIFYQVFNMRHLNIFTNENLPTASGYNTSAIFYACKQISDVVISGSTSNFIDIRLFLYCYNINNINSYMSIKKFASYCQNISNFKLNITSDISSNTEYLFDNCESISNIYIANSSYYTKYFSTCNYITSCRTTTDSSHNTNIKGDSGNSWNNIKLLKSSNYTIKRDETIIYSNSLGVVTYTLPSASDNHENRIYIIKDMGGDAKNYNITIQTQGSDKIDVTKNSMVININYGAIALIAIDNSNWATITLPTVYGY